MKITYNPTTGRFLAEAKYHEKEVLKSAGFRWDPEKKLWWTSDKVGALKLRRHFDDEARKVAQADEEKLEETFSASALTEPSPRFTVPSPAGRKFFPYQLAGIEYALGRTNTLIGDEMGVGKTCQAIGVINATPETKRVLIICPASLKLNWMNELKNWLSRPARIRAIYANGKHRQHGTSEGLQIEIMNYDIVGKYDVKSEEWDLLIIDECFPAGTRIKTPHGLKSIEDLKIGDTVCNAVGEGTITDTGKQYAKIITLKTDAGEIRVTPHHPFLIDTGWEFAKNLSGKTLKTQGDCLRVLRGDLPKQTKADSILREVLLSEVEDGATGNTCKGPHTGGPSENCREATVDQETGGYDGIAIIQTNETQQPNEKPRDSGESVGCYGWEDTISPSGERVGANGTREENNVSFPGPCVESPGQDECGEDKRGKLPHMLQGGLGRRAEEDGGGSKWGEPHFSSQTGTGSKEDTEIGRVRVESVVNHEQGCDGNEPVGVEVHNLSVSGHPSYIVVIGGKEVVVHNCHYLKNSTSKRRREIWGGRSQKPGQPVKVWKAIPAKRTLALTGTPVCNRPNELWTMLRAMDPERWPSTAWERFHVRYCGAVKTKFGWDTAGADNLGELNKILRGSIMVRRVKKDVLKDLPDKMRKTTKLETTPEVKKLLEQEEALAYLVDVGVKNADPEKLAIIQDFVDKNADEDKEATAVGMLSKIRRMVGELKAPLAVEYAKELLESGAESLVIFAHHKKVVADLEEGLKEFGVVKIVGGMKADDVQASVDNFQKATGENSHRVFIGSITAAGVGITLTRATHTLFVEVDWVPGNLAQAEDRTHRIGQKNAVLIEYLIFEGSIDQQIISTVEAKQDVINSITR